MTAYVPSGGSTSFAEVIRSLTSLASGRSNATGTITLAAGATATTKVDRNYAAGAAIVLSPTTANAAAALAGCYFQTTNNGSFTVNHANNAQTDRTFIYAIVG